MKEEEFRIKAKEMGITEAAVEQAIAMHEKFLCMGMMPASYEEILAAKQKKSCVEVFESALDAH